MRNLKREITTVKQKVDELKSSLHGVEEKDEKHIKKYEEELTKIFNNFTKKMNALVKEDLKELDKGFVRLRQLEELEKKFPENAHQYVKEKEQVLKDMGRCAKSLHNVRPLLEENGLLLNEIDKNIPSQEELKKMEDMCKKDLKATQEKIKNLDSSPYSFLPGWARPAEASKPEPKPVQKVGEVAEDREPPRPGRP